jgi:DNA-binding GntR family transcriptional regulator
MVSPLSNIGLQVQPLHHETLEELIYRELIDLILDGEIAPGQQVTIQSLAKGFGVSATPVREALKRLTAANALQVVSGRSIGIPRLSLERLVDLRNVRLELEGIATEWASRHVSNELFLKLEAELVRMASAIAAEDSKTYLRANRAFHFIVYQASGSPSLVSIIEVLWLQISPYFNLLKEEPGNYASANVRHRNILVALQNADGAAARQAVRADIEAAFETLSRLLGDADSAAGQ